jgi:hypothetical protein
MMSFNPEDKTTKVRPPDGQRMWTSNSWDNYQAGLPRVINDHNGATSSPYAKIPQYAKTPQGHHPKRISTQPKMSPGMLKERLLQAHRNQNIWESSAKSQQAQHASLSPYVDLLSLSEI